MRPPELQGLIRRRMLVNLRADPGVFPAGSIRFDHALIMRDIPHRWRALPEIALGAPGCGV